MLNRRFVLQIPLLILSFLVTVTCCSAQVTPSLHVIALANSGLPDQFFDLTSGADIAQVQNSIQGLPSALDPHWVNLGWRGFQIENQGIASFPASEVRVLGGVIRVIAAPGSTPLFYQDLNGLEAFLTARLGGLPAPAAPSSPAASFAIPSISLSGMAAVVSPPPMPTSGSEPPYNPGSWNGVANNQSKNNCYNYACNKKTNTFAQPGRKGGTPITFPLSCKSVTAAAKSDGLVPQNCDLACPEGSYKVALVVDPTGGDGLGPDFHWYRQDSGGNWSHKPGAGEATNQDSSGKAIPDPRTADRRRKGKTAMQPGYTDFCGCFCVDPTKVAIQ
jgi:hypothetical protein